MYRHLNSHGLVHGFSALHYFGRHAGSSVLVLDHFGPDLQTVLDKRRRLSTRTLLLIAEQCVQRLHSLHAVGYLHRDVKPSNFALGQPGAEENTVYLVNLGYATRFSKARRQRRPSMGGRFSSVAEHSGGSLGAKDDLESLVYMLAYLATGRLPWGGSSVRGSKAEMIERIVAQKREVRGRELFAGTQTAFGVLLDRVRGMSDGERPDYEGIREMFQRAARQI